MASGEALVLSPVVAKAPLLACPPRKRSPNRGEVSLLKLLKSRHKRYLTQVQSNGSGPDGMARGEVFHSSQRSADTSVNDSKRLNGELLYRFRKLAT